MLEAKSNLSRLVRAIEEGREEEIVIARSGRPAARLVAIRATAAAQPIGVAKARLVPPVDIDADNPSIAALFGVSTRQTG